MNHLCQSLTRHTHDSDSVVNHGSLLAGTNIKAGPKHKRSPQTTLHHHSAVSLYLGGTHPPGGTHCWHPLLAPTGPDTGVHTHPLDLMMSDSDAMKQELLLMNLISYSVFRIDFLRPLFTGLHSNTETYALTHRNQ
jgi:hypothetical protein